MAGLTPDLPLPNSSFFNIYNDGPIASVSPLLPGGQCNFVDLSHGANGPKCGCRRFWSRGASGSSGRGSPMGYPPGFSNGVTSGKTTSSEDQAAFCMCSHHACFHDDVRDDQGAIAIQPFPGDVTNNGQENDKPRTNREPLTPMIPDLSFKLPSGMGHTMDFDVFNHATNFSAHPLDNANMQQGGTVAPMREASLPDTMSWSNFIQTEPDPSLMLPPIPSQCLMPSQPSSTTSSTRRGYLRPFAGKGLQTLSGVKSRLREPPAENDEEDPRREEDAIDARVDPCVDEAPTVTNTPRSSRHSDVEASSPQPVVGPSREDFQMLSDTIQGHEERLDKLENVSFSTATHDNCSEKYDQTDLRVTELESRVEEVEKILNDSSSHSSSYRRSQHPGVDEAGSVISFSTNGSDHTITRAELYSQLQALKSQLSHLQGLSSYPSASRPWEIEVVFLPFPLKGLWMESADFASQHASSGSNFDPWTQLPNSLSFVEPQSPDYGDWIGPELETDWLLARACAPARMIDQRLKSRGLVQNVTVRGPDARSVQEALSEAFGTLFRTFSRMQANVHHGSTMHHRVSKFLGLQSPWVPLRKVYKDSRLHFLSPAEMVTPVTWDVQFLSSSVVMKAGDTERLFITQPEAYLQDQDAYDNGWNWQRLRELSRVYADSQSSQEVPEADAKENCWSWNKYLDESAAPSATRSQTLSLRQSAQQGWRRATSKPPSNGMHVSSSSLAALPYAHRRSSGLRSNSRAQSPAILREHKLSTPSSTSVKRSLHIRTTSMPPAVPAAIVSPAILQSKRRVTSYERRASPQVVRVASAAAPAKRRRNRSSRSPSIMMTRPLMIRRTTPRCGTASPSPMPEVFGVAGGRAPTPAYYATPYSNATGFVDTRRGPGILVMDGDFEMYEDEDVELEDEGDIDLGFYEDDEGDDPFGFDEEEDDDEEEEDSQMTDVNTKHSGTLPRNHHEWAPKRDGRDEKITGAGPEDEPLPGIEDAENRDPGAIGGGVKDELEEDLDLGIPIHVDEDADMSNEDNDTDDDDDDAFHNVDGYVDDEEEYEGFGSEESQGPSQGIQRHSQGVRAPQDQASRASSERSSVPSEYPTSREAWATTTLSGSGSKGILTRDDDDDDDDDDAEDADGFAVFEDVK
ncbi:hypothetical protein F4778DRAFT_167532 [Xylariomycetidae sp. FL2044]|nr:hypothetical protein F4778DRAFT_167532 [Xylariomycetidae sp. FL2044]